MGITRGLFTMIDIILAKYGTPKGTALWRHHLPSILIGVLLLVGSISFGLQQVDRILVGTAVIIATQFVFAFIARQRFGYVAPKNSIYYKE